MKSPSPDLPTQTAVEKKLLQLLLGCHPRCLKTQAAYDQLAESMGITPEQRWAKLTTASGEENAWENIVRYARLALVERGHVHSRIEARRGVWCQPTRESSTQGIRAGSYLTTTETCISRAFSVAVSSVLECARQQQTHAQMTLGHYLFPPRGSRSGITVTRGSR